jgi:hypothetical protein
LDFTIQYFGELDRLLHMENVEALEMAGALERARAVLKQPPAFDDDPRIIGYVILDNQGRQVARGYRRNA